MINPLVSVIVPCYNQAQYLSEALQSVLEQTFKNWECIIVNDGSPDNTEEVAQEWLAKDVRFKYLQTENKGVSSARNIGIDEAIGKFILPLDADDKIAINYLKNGIDSFKRNKELKLVYCKAEKFGDENGIWILPEFSPLKLASDNVIFCSAIFKKPDWNKIGGYDEKMIRGLEDWEFWIALLKSGGEVFRLDEVGFYYRIKKSSRQSDLNKMNKSDLLEYISIKHADFFVKQLGSFMHLNHLVQKQKTDFEEKLKSERFVLKLFINTVLPYFKIK